MNINRGDIWYVMNSYQTVGSEQRPGRPAVVVSNQKNNQYGDVVEMVFLTTAPKRDLPTHVTIRSSGRVSTALCEQISTVSVERLGNYCGHVSDSELAAIEGAMLVSLGIQFGSEVENEETPPCGITPCRSRGPLSCFARDVRFAPEPAHCRLKTKKARAA